MTGFLEGKVVLITGGARGQGRAHATTCAREGADVVVVDTTSPIDSVPYDLATDSDLDQTRADVEALDRRIITVDADVRDQAALDGAVDSALSEFGRLDVLIANAGIWSHGPFWEMSEEQWGTVIDVNLNGAWRAAKAVAPQMMKQRSGSIVLTSSDNALEPGFQYAHYCSAKAGVLGLMRNVALELAPYGVRCNAICPGGVLTPMLEAFNTHGPSPVSPEEFQGWLHHFHALANTGPLDPQVEADAALFLNSPLAAKITGVTLPVDAGHMILPGYNHAPVK